MVNLSQDVARAFDYVIKRLPTSITYSRFDKTVYVPGEGYKPDYWEEPPFDAVVSGVTQSEIDSSGGRLQIDDRSFSFKASKFKSQGDDDPLPLKPQAGDNIAVDDTELTSGMLIVGKRYRIKDWITDDDFTNVGGTNEDGNEFTATGTTPTTWTNSSILVQIVDYKVDLGDGVTLYRKDITNELWIVYGRKF